MPSGEMKHVSISKLSSSCRAFQLFVSHVTVQSLDASNISRPSFCYTQTSFILKMLRVSSSNKRKNTVCAASVVCSSPAVKAQQSLPYISRVISHLNCLTHLSVLMSVQYPNNFIEWYFVIATIFQIFTIFYRTCQKSHNTST